MDARSWTLLLSLGAIWGASYMFIEIGLRDLSPGTVAFVRVALAAAVLLPDQGVLRRPGRRRTRSEAAHRRLRRRDDEHGPRGSVRGDEEVQEEGQEEEGEVAA